MKIRLLAGAAFAALTMTAVPATGATVGSTSAVQTTAATADPGVEAFYASRGGAPLWLRDGPNDARARTIINILQRAQLDGLASGPALAAHANSLIARAGAGDRAALDSADRLLSVAWVRYVQSVQRAPTGMTVADGWAAPRRDTSGAILARAATARSLDEHLRTVSRVNPIYAELRDAAWNAAQASGGQADGRVLSNLDRIRTMPFQQRYIVVDTASAKLWMVENGRIADSMKVIVGKASSPTPMVASTIYYATLNPYWNVPADLVQKLIAPRVVDQGVKYLKSHNYEVLSGFDEAAQPVDPAKVNWKAVAAGSERVRVRQLPGPANSMGRVKFAFPNASDVYLHDTPRKELFSEADRDLSNGCIRLEDAARLSRWLIGRDPTTQSSEPEQHVLLPKPVPVYVTYLTAQNAAGQLTFIEDVYGHDRQSAAQIAGLR